MEFEEMVRAVEQFYREYFSFSQEEEMFLWLYFNLKRRRGLLNREVLRTPSNAEKLRSLLWLINRKLRKEVVG